MVGCHKTTLLTLQTRRTEQLETVNILWSVSQLSASITSISRLDNQLQAGSGTAGCETTGLPDSCAGSQVIFYRTALSLNK